MRLEFLYSFLPYIQQRVDKYASKVMNITRTTSYSLTACVFTVMQT